MKKVTIIGLIAVVVIITASIVYAVGSTRISGQAGAAIDLKAYLSGDLTEVQVPVSVANTSWTYGTGANAVNVIYADTVTIADDANDTLDLYASGTLLDIYNRALTMEAIKFLYVKNNSADATLRLFGEIDVNDINIMSEPNDIINIKPGGHFLWMDPSAAGLSLTEDPNLFIDHNGTGTSTMAVDVIAMGLD